MLSRVKIYKTTLIKSILYWVLLLWTLFVSSLLIKEFCHSKREIEELALIEAKSNTQKDIAYRNWVAGHGGIYVEISKNTPPNKYLNIPKRDVITNYGQHLTLMNPAYTLRETMAQFSNLYNIKTKITSLKVTNPINSPDEWERKALNVVEKSKDDFHEFVKSENIDYLRFLSPFIVQESCLKCHGHQGYKIGDIRGGISVSMPMTPYNRIHNEILKGSVINYSLMWIVGLFIIILAYGRILKYMEERIKNYEQNIYSLISTIEKRDSYTAGHGKRVAQYSKLIATAMKFDEDDISLIYRAGMLHDIGKVATPDSVLLKPGRLSEVEYNIIKEHVTVSYELIRDVDIFKDMAELIKYHHERYDGNGYPYGLSGNEIPMLSNIMAFADAFDAMTTDRIYKGRKSVHEALSEAEEQSGKQFHPEVVKVAKVVLQDISISDLPSQLPESVNEYERLSLFFRDRLTGIYNSSYLEFIIKSGNIDKYNYAYTIKLEKFSIYNKKSGWSSGDTLLEKIALSINNISEDGVAIRLYGDDFLLFLNSELDIQSSVKSIFNPILLNTGVSIKIAEISVERVINDKLEDLFQ